MNRIPKASYTLGFRAEAVKLAQEVGSSEPARRLSISIKTLANWQCSDKAGDLAKLGSPQLLKTEAESELSRVKRELAEVKMERDLLKKFAANFARGSR